MAFVATTAAALAETVEAKEGPGAGANAGGSGSWLELAAVLLVLAAVAAVLVVRARTGERKSAAVAPQSATPAHDLEQGLAA